MTLQQLKSFIAIVNTGSFSKAEETTFLTKQALKKQIDSLEAELEFKLISRSSKGIILTEAGEIFYKAAQKWLIQYNELLENCRLVSKNTNQIRIGNPSHPRLLLEKVFYEYMIRYPDVHQEIITGNENLVQRVLDGDLDIAEITYRPSKLSDGLSYQRIKTLEYSCVMTEAHPLAGKKTITPEDLKPYHVGIVGHANAELSEHLRRNYPEIKLQNLNNSELQSIINVCYNQGIYISKAYFAHLLAPLITIPFESDFKFDCGVIYRNNPTVPVKNFLELIQIMYPDNN